MSVMTDREELPDLKMSKAQHDKPGEGLKHCDSCDKYYLEKDMSCLQGRVNCRFCLPHCAVCLGEKHLNEFYDLDSLDVLCIGCKQRVIRTCERCNKTFRDWLNEEAERCEDCADMSTTDEDDSD